MTSEETATGYKATRCDLCSGLCKVQPVTADEWRIRNEPLGKR